MLRVEAFGGLGIRMGADLLGEGRIQRRQQALLVLLAVSGERGASRDRLLALLWPENTEESARHNLKQSLYLLRRAVGDAVVGRDVLRLDPALVTSDVGDFDAALARSDFAAAAALYRGPLLDAVYLSESEEWQRWLDGARDRYARLYLGALQSLAERHDAQGSPEEAVRYWRRVADADPFSARVAMRLMQALERSGDHGAALRVAEEHATRVRDELGAEPAAEVAALAERIRREPAAPVLELPPPALPPALPAGGRPSRPQPGVAARPAWSAGAGEAESPSAKRRVLRRRHVAIGVLAGGLVFGAIPFITGGRTDRSARKPDEHAVAVLPFRVATPDPGLAYLREGLMDLLSSVLTGDGPAHAVDSRTVMAAMQGVVRSTTGDLPRDEALTVARRVGAGQLLLGEVLGVPSRPGAPERLIVSAALVEVEDGRTRAQARTEGPADSLTLLVDRLAGQLLFGESGDAEHRSASALTTSLPALRAYLDGEAADRRFDGVAVDHFLRAIQLDSTFALAGLRLHLAAGWAVDRRVPEGAGERGLWIAWAHRDRLSERDRAILTVRTGLRFPALSGIPAILEYQTQAASRFPEEPEIWLQLGETYFHSGSLLGLTDWRERFKAAAENALRLDPEHAKREALPHLIALYAREGDTAQVRRLRAFRGENAAPEQLDRLLSAQEIAAGDVARVREWRAVHRRAALDTLPLQALQRLVWDRVTWGVGVEDAESAAVAMLRRAATPAERNAALASQVYLSLARGRPLAAARARRAHLAAATSESQRRRVLSNAIYDALYDDGSRDLAASAADELERLLARGKPRGILAADFVEGQRESAAARSLHSCALAQWRLANGDTRSIRKHLAALRTPTSPVLPPFSPELIVPFRQRACSAVLTAWLAVLERRPQADSLLARADASLRTEIPLWLIGYPELYAGNIAVARLFAVRGDSAHALAAIRRHSYGTNAPTFLAAFAREQARFAAAAGEREEAVEAYRYYLTLRSDPEPSMRPAAEQARLELARLLARPASPVRH